jgi:ABC-type oligopeptide transport system substrate-binding subunit
MEPTDRILPPSVRGARAPRSALPELARALRLVGSRHVIARMAVQAGDDNGRQFANVVHVALAPLGIDVQPVTVADVGAAMRDPRARIALAALGTEVDYPDPASFLTQMLGNDVPAAWLPASNRAAVDRLVGLTGAARDRAALVLAARLETRDVPVVAYGTPTIGAALGPRLRCRIWNGVDPGLDLAALCLKPS